ncbi:MAG TPA: slipin family protein [Terriglobales bacterium]|nr:slipin family protein [Terriglobales bacterium]
MSRSLLYSSVTVKAGERVLLLRDGRYVDVLEPGRHTFLDPLRKLSLERYDVVRTELPIERYNVIKAERPDLADELLALVETGANEVGIVSLDGRPAMILGPWQRKAYWKVVTAVDLERVDTTDVLEATDRQMTLMNKAASLHTVETVVESHEAALLYVNGRLIGRLAPGRYAHWTVNRKLEVKRLDLRPQPVEITAQEMLTKDRISLRVTLTAYRRITDPERAVTVAADIDGWLYRLVQLAIREAVGARSLDEVLSGKGVLDAELRGYVEQRLADTGIVVTELGIKDVILPGDIRELVNKVVEAERLAKANLIRRQEETAATRSLLNTAKLMEENPLLLRLKELESLERLVEKVGRIDLHAGDGQGLDALLTKLVRLKQPEAS